jgi:hypothetical protein
MSRVVIRPAASSAVTSVNGQTGVVVLDAADVGAVESVNAQTGVVVLDAGDVGAVATDTSGSSDVLAIWGGTQAEYDAIVSPTATTLYVITA